MKGILKKGLSPLVASTILVVIAIIGGIMLYQYYNTLMTSLSSSSEILVIKRARIVVIDDTTAVIYLDIWNPSSYTAKIHKIIIDTNYNVTTNTSIPPASTYQIMIKINRTLVPNLNPGTKHYVSLVYELREGLLHYTDLYQVIVE